MSHRQQSRRGFVKTVGAGAVAATLSQNTSATAQAADKPNILFIISDQHFADTMSCNGIEILRTPSMDRIARDGVRFTKCYVSNPLCIPSRASFMTGKMPTQCSGNPGQFKGLGNYLKEAGYDTGYFGKWHIKSEKPEADNPWHGFDTIDTKGLDPAKSSNSVDFIKKKRNNPFFMVSSFMNPHDICQWARIHSGVDDEIENGDVPPTPDPAACPELPHNHQPPNFEPEVVRKRLTIDARRRDFTHPTANWKDGDWRQYRWAYCRLIELVDRHVGELLDALEDTGQMDNTVVIYTSDHGDGFGAHKWNQKMVLYEESARVPFIVSWRGKTRAGAVDTLRLINMNLDLIPSVCDFAGAPAPSDLLGKSIKPLVMAGSTLHVSAQHHPFVVSETRLYEGAQGRLLTTGRYKYIVYESGDHPEQLFDLEKDPGEMNTLVYDPAHRHELERHRSLLKDWMARIGDGFTLDHVMA